MGGQQLEWLNELIKRLWPHFDQALAKIMKGSVTAKIQENVPYALKGLYFRHFTLGSKAAKLGPVKAVRGRDGVRINLGVDFESDACIDLGIGLLSFGLKSL